MNFDRIMNRSEKIHEIVAELSDVNLQRKLWLNENNDTGLISSYTELMCTLFDDLGFDEFLVNSAKLEDLSDSTIRELVIMRDMLNDYKAEETDREIIEDPKWRKIVFQAKQVLKVWKRNDNDCAS